MDILMGIWTWFANNILTQPAYFIGLIVVLGYALMKKPWYDILAGFIKMSIGLLPFQWFLHCPGRRSAPSSSLWGFRG